MGHHLGAEADWLEVGIDGAGSASAVYSCWEEAVGEEEIADEGESASGAYNVVRFGKGGSEMSGCRRF